MRINTIAEGVETQAELDLLRNMGCEEYSGHLLAEPAMPSEFETGGWLNVPRQAAALTRRAAVRRSASTEAPAACSSLSMVVARSDR